MNDFERKKRVESLLLSAIVLLNKAKNTVEGMSETTNENLHYELSHHVNELQQILFELEGKDFRMEYR